MCSNHFHTLLTLLEFPSGLFERKVEKQWSYTLPFYQIILTMIYIGQMITYTDFTIV
jgi:hypothetical protein